MNRSPSTLVRGLSCLGLLCGANGCGPLDGGNADEAQDFNGSSESPIINGSVVTTDTLGLAFINTPIGRCSSTQLSDTWLLTARHCVEGVPANQITASLGTGIATATAFLYEMHPTLDIALIRLATRLTDPSQDRSFSNPIYFGSTQSLLGRTLACFGYGRDTFDGGTGTLRTASLRVASLVGNGFRMTPNGSGQIQFHGDSGGPCTTTVDGVRYVAGVHRYCIWDETNKTVLSCDSEGAEAFRDWVWATMGVAVGLFQDDFYAGRTQAVIGGGFTTGQLLVGNNAISSIRVPVGWTAYLFDGDNFQGNVRTQFVDTAALFEFSDKTSSVVVADGGYVRFYRDISFSGPVTNLFPGRYDVASLGIGNDQLTSLRIPAHYRVTLFEHASFSGASIRFHAGDIAYVGHDWNDRTSSIIIEEPIRAYEHSNFNGRFTVLWPGRYDVTSMGLPNDSISSLAIPAGFGIRLYQHDGFTGTVWTYTGGSPTIGAANDQASSLEVFRL